MSNEFTFGADDARELTRSALSMSGEAGRDETMSIVREIKAAAALGKTSYSTELPAALIDLIMKRFTANGFTCTKSQQGFGGGNPNIVTFNWSE